MKKNRFTPIVMAVFAAAALTAPADTITNASVTNTPSLPVATNAAPVASATNAPAATNSTAAVEPDENIAVTNAVRLNFHDAPLSTVVTYLSKRMGFIFSSDVELHGTATIESQQPMGTNDVLQWFSGVLAKNDYSIISNGRILTITSASNSKTAATTPVKQALSPEQIPMSDEIATIVLPVHTLNPTQLVKDLTDVIPPGTTLDANEAGNALVMTGRQKDIHRFDEIIAALDSSSVADVAVFVLKYADSKSVAEELKEVFQSPDSQVARSDSRQRFRGFGGGGFFGGGGGGGGEGSSSSTEKNASNKAVFTSDDQMNAVVAAAPHDYFQSITNIIAMLDQPNQDVTVMRVFHLKFADAQEMADELANLFPDDTKTSTDQNSRSAGFRFMPPWAQQSSSSTSGQSERMKRQTEVRAVPDLRTASLIVTTSRDLMEQIAGVITDLDTDHSGVQNVYSFDIDSADPTSVQQLTTALFAGPNQRSQQNSSPSALEQRATSAAQQQTQSTSSFGSGGLGSSALH